MKKFSLIVLLLLLAVATTVACQHGDNNGTTTTDGSTNPVTDASTTTGAETEAGNISVNGVTVEGLNGWFEYGGNLTLRDRYEAVGTRDSMSISMAKNEMEGFQYVLLAGQNYDGLRCEVSALSDGNGNTLEGIVHVAYNIYVNKSDGFRPRGYTPEILMPQDDDYQGGTFDLVAMRAKTLYVLYKTDINTVPGIYTGRLEIKQGDDVLLSGEVSVKVWDIYYDEKTECKTLYQYGYNSLSAPGLGPDSAPEMHVGLAENAFEVRQQYVDFMLSYRFSPWNLPIEGELLNEDMALIRKYMDNPRLNTTYICQQNNAYEQQSLVAEENGWLDKVAIFSYEEPAVPEAIDAAKERALDIRSRTSLTQFNGAWCPSIATQRAWMFPKEGPNIFERFAEFTTMTTINAITVSEPEVYEALQAYRAKGNTVFWYVCGNQGKRHDLINMLTCTPGTEKRILFWQQYQHDIDGFLMFHTMWWNGYEDMWAEDYEDRKFKLPRPTLDGPTGDGVMIYWHPTTGDPLSSLTLEANRDGIEDFQLLRMAEYTLGKDIAMSYAERITTAVNIYTKDASLLAQVRQELGDALEAALLS